MAQQREPRIKDRAIENNGLIIKFWSTRATQQKDVRSDNVGTLEQPKINDTE